MLFVSEVDVWIHFCSRDKLAITLSITWNNKLVETHARRFFMLPTKYFSQRSDVWYFTEARYDFGKYFPNILTPYSYNDTSMFTLMTIKSQKFWNPKQECVWETHFKNNFFCLNSGVWSSWTIRLNLQRTCEVLPVKVTR